MRSKAKTIFSSLFTGRDESVCKKSVLAMYAAEAYIICMQTMIKERKTQRFVARVTDADRLLFKQAATLEGRSMATFIISHGRQAAQQVIQQSSQIQLDAAQSRRFVEALLAPPKPPTPALTRAMARYRRVVTSP